MKALPLVVLCALLASGCAGPAPKASADVPEPVEVDGAIIAADKALIEGYVVSDAGLVIPGARVSMLGTDNYTDSDDRGAFAFENVSTGDIELQAVHPSYQAHVHRLTVTAATRVLVNLTLLPKTALGTELPHNHDHWEGKPTYLLFDDDIDLQERPQGSVHPDAYWAAYNAVVRPNVASAEAARWPIPVRHTPGGGPALVLPGTAKLSLSLTWDSQTIRTEGIGFCYDSANRDPIQCLPLDATSPAAWTIDVNGSMADAGHQPFSLWSLWISVTPLNGGTGGLPDVMYGSIHAKVELTRGEILVDPPHPDFWGAGNERLVMNETQAIAYTCCSQPPTFYPDDLVPPGTTRLRIDHTWGADGAGGQVPWEFSMLVRTASMGPYAAQSEWLRPTVTGGSLATRHLVYEFDVAAIDTDGYYQASSFWRFSPYQPRFEPTGYDSTAGVAVRHAIVVTAIRGA